IMLWDMTTMRSIKLYDTSTYASRYTAWHVSFSPDGRFILIALEQGTRMQSEAGRKPLIIYDLIEKTAGVLIEAGEAVITAVSFAPDNNGLFMVNRGQEWQDTSRYRELCDSLDITGKEGSISDARLRSFVFTDPELTFDDCIVLERLLAKLK